ncbi:MAG TPA: c-type cytochrome [Steroidobacteraceae bacterium]|nr:c-type cytochrome [Steroidobacteraceae bacterium]
MKSQLLVIGVLTALSVAPLTHGASNAAQEGTDALATRPDFTNGAQLFKSCAACHGESGAGTPDGQVPRIAGQHFSVLVKQLVDYRNNQRWDPRMQYMADKHLLKTAQDIADVAAYASQITLSADDGVGVGSGEFLGRGRAVFQSSCESCHGPAGEGSGTHAIPQLAGQNYAYLVRQIHDAVEGRRPNFPASHIRLLKRLDYADITGVADYLARIPRKVEPVIPQGLADLPSQQPPDFGR